MNRRRIVLSCLASMLTASLALAQSAPQSPRTSKRLAVASADDTPAVPTVPVQVMNFPAVQSVAGEIACSNLPLDDAGNVRVSSGGGQDYQAFDLVTEPIQVGANG